jgi:hypothetical protein
VTRDAPPMKACAPMRTNWWMPHMPPTTTQSSMTTWPAHVDRVRQNDVVADLAVVRDVRVRHQQAVAADDGAAGGGRAAVQRRELAHDGAVAHF